MVQGFNHNIKHKGKLYHIQTEDSGRDNPHIITHVFVGGNILATKKTSYADISQADRLEQIVRELMEEQHKSVLRNLINGVYDNPERQSTEIGEPVTLASTGARVAPNGGAEPFNEDEIEKTRESKPATAATAPMNPQPPQPPVMPVSSTARAPAPPPNSTRAKPAVPPPTPPAPHPAAPPPAAGKGNEKSLDEIILSYLADREE